MRGRGSMPALLTQSDIKLSSELLFELPEDYQKFTKVEFQFPPKILSDSRKATWNEVEYKTQTEPIAIFASSGPREFALQITYIYDGGVWGVDKISKQVKLMRGYFQRVKDADAQRNLVIRLKLWGIGGADPMSARMKSCDAKYSETMIYDGDHKKAYPLRTDVTCDLALWTQGTAASADQKLPRLEQYLTAEWY